MAPNKMHPAALAMTHVLFAPAEWLCDGEFLDVVELW